MEKRCFNQTEAMAYLGVKAKFFQTQIRPRLRGIKAGVSMIYERAELDQAWENYKMAVCGAAQEEKTWDVHQVSTKTKKVDLTLTRPTKVTAFANAASKVLSARKAG